MKDIDSFGKYQFIIYSLISYPLLLSAGFTLDYVFTAGETKYRCLVPECEDPNNATLSGLDWIDHSAPWEKGALANCKRYAVRDQSELTEGCTASSFITNETIECNAWVFDPDDITIQNEWGFTCDYNRWRLTLVGTLNNLGQLVGLTFASYFSDKYGRRTVLTVITCLGGVSGLIHSFSVNYYMFIAFEFIDAIFTAGIFSSGFIYAMEMTGVEQRVLGSTITSCVYALGEIWLGLAAMWLRNWRYILRVIFAPGMLTIFLIFLLPESVRWLLANNKKDVAAKVYRRMARINNIKVDEESFYELKAEPKSVAEKSRSTDVLPETSRIKQIFKSPKILIRLLICSFCWLTNTFVYYGLSLNSTEFAGDKYVNFILVAAIEIPACVIVYPLLDNIGRKATLCTSFLLSGAFCLTIQFIPLGLWKHLPLVLYVCGKGCITMSFVTVYVYTAELFPTTLRHSLLGICSMTGRVGSILAPQTPLLENVFQGLPLILFGSMSVGAGFLALTFPETLHQKLPDTITEAEQVGNKQQQQPQRPLNGNCVS